MDEEPDAQQNSPDVLLNKVIDVLRYDAFRIFRRSEQTLTIFELTEMVKLFVDIDTEEEYVQIRPSAVMRAINAMYSCGMHFIRDTNTGNSYCIGTKGVQKITHKEMREPARTAAQLRDTRDEVGPLEGEPYFSLPDRVELDIEECVQRIVLVSALAYEEAESMSATLDYIECMPLRSRGVERPVRANRKRVAVPAPELRVLLPARAEPVPELAAIEPYYCIGLSKLLTAASIRHLCRFMPSEKTIDVVVHECASVLQLEPAESLSASRVTAAGIRHINDINNGAH